MARPRFKSLREPSLHNSEDVPRESGTRKLEQNEDETNSNDQSTSWSLNSENNRSSSSESMHSSGSWVNTTSHKSSDSTSSLRASEYTTLSEPLEAEAPQKSWSSLAPSSKGSIMLSPGWNKKRKRTGSSKKQDDQRKLSSMPLNDENLASRSSTFPSKESRELNLKWGLKEKRKARSCISKGTGYAKVRTLLDAYVRTVELPEPGAASSDQALTSEVVRSNKRKEKNAKAAENDRETFKGKQLLVGSMEPHIRSARSKAKRPVIGQSSTQGSQMPTTRRRTERGKDLRKDHEGHPEQVELAKLVYKDYIKNGRMGYDHAFRELLDDVGAKELKKLITNYHSRCYRQRKKFGIPASKEKKLYTKKQKKEIQRVTSKLSYLKSHPELFETLWDKDDEWSVHHSYMSAKQRASFIKQVELTRAGKPPKTRERRSGADEKRGDASKTSKSSSKAMEDTSKTSLSAESQEAPRRRGRKS